MGRKRKQANFIDNVNIPPWMKGKDKIKGFAMPTDSLFQDEAFQTLTEGEKVLLIAMAIVCRGKRTFTFPAEDYTRMGFAKSSFIDRAKKLEKKGFIKRKTYYNGKPTEYTFCK